MLWRWWCTVSGVIQTTVRRPGVLAVCFCAGHKPLYVAICCVVATLLQQCMLGLHFALWCVVLVGIGPTFIKYSCDSTGPCSGCMLCGQGHEGLAASPGLCAAALLPAFNCNEFPVGSFLRQPQDLPVPLGFVVAAGFFGLLYGPYKLVLFVCRCVVLVQVSCAGWDVWGLRWVLWVGKAEWFMALAVRVKPCAVTLWGGQGV